MGGIGRGGYGGAGMGGMGGGMGGRGGPSGGFSNFARMRMENGEPWDDVAPVRNPSSLDCYSCVLTSPRRIQNDHSDYDAMFS